SWLAHKLAEQPPSVRERVEAQIVPIKFEEVEGAKMHVAASIAQPLEVGETGFGTGDRLPVNQARGHLEDVQRLEDEREAFGPVVAIAGEQPHSRGPTPRQEPEAVM